MNDNDVLNEETGELLALPNGFAYEGPRDLPNDEFEALRARVKASRPKLIRYELIDAEDSGGWDVPIRLGFVEATSPRDALVRGRFDSLRFERRVSGGALYATDAGKVLVRRVHRDDRRAA